MHRLSAFSIRHPAVVLTLGVLLTCAAAPGLLRLKIRTDGHALIPPDAQAIEVDQQLREKFHQEDPVILFLTSNHELGVFNAETLQLVEDLSADLAKLREVRPQDVFSLATEHGHRVKPGTLNFRRFLDPVPQSREDLLRLRDDLRAIKLYGGTLVSTDERSTAVMVGVPRSRERSEFLNEIHSIARARQDKSTNIRIIGAPVAESLLGTHLLQDLGVPSQVLGESADLTDMGEPTQSPTSLHKISTYLAEKVGLVPVAIFVMFVIFAISFKNLTAAALPLMEVGACLVFVFGLMGYLDIPVYLTIAVMPVILTAIGVADEIHIFSRYREHLRDHPTQHASITVRNTMHELASPVFKTSATTAIAFLSFALSPIRPVQAFGAFTAIGVVFCMAWSLTVIPATLSIAPKSWFCESRMLQSSLLRNPIHSLVPIIISLARKRVVIICLALAILVLSIAGSLRIAVQDSWIDGFAEQSPLRQAMEEFNTQFLGMHTLFIEVDAGNQTWQGKLRGDSIDRSAITLSSSVVANAQSLVGCRIRVFHPRGANPQRLPPRERRRYHWESWITAATLSGEAIQLTCMKNHSTPKVMMRLSDDDVVQFEILSEPMKNPDMLRRIDDFESVVRSKKSLAVGGVVGVTDFLKTTNLMSYGLQESERRIPDAVDRIAWLWTQYERIRGRERMEQVVSADYSQALVTVFLKNANFADTAQLIQEIKEYAQTNFAPAGISIRMGGDVAVSQTLIEAIVTTQTRSLLISLVGIWLVTTISYASLKLGLLSVLPCAIAVLVNFGVMGAIGMPLGVATSMFACMTLGIGVDYAIHFLSRYRIAIREGREPSAAIADSIQRTAPAIIVDALGVGLGFGVLVLSQVPANARLGGLVILSIFGCLVMTLWLLPALLGLGIRNTKNLAAE